MWILILLDHRDCHANSFPTDVLFFKWIRSFQHSRDQFSVLCNGVCFIRPKLSLFSRPPTLFFKDSYMLIKYPFIHVKPLHSLQSMFLPGDFHEVGHEFQVHHSSFSYSSPVDLTQAFGVDHIPFLVSNATPCRCIS